MYRVGKYFNGLPMSKPWPVALAPPQIEATVVSPGNRHDVPRRSRNSRKKTTTLQIEMVETNLRLATLHGQENSSKKKSMKSNERDGLRSWKSDWLAAISFGTPKRSKKKSTTATLPDRVDCGGGGGGGGGFFWKRRYWVVTGFRFKVGRGACVFFFVFFVLWSSHFLRRRR